MVARRAAPERSRQGRSSSQAWTRRGTDGDKRDDVWPAARATRQRYPRRRCPRARPSAAPSAPRSGRLRRDRLRRELRRPHRRPRARRLGRPRARARPLRDRRAPDVGLRGPDRVARAMGLAGSVRQEFGDLVVHTPHGTARYELPLTFSTFDYRELCGLLWDAVRRRVRDRKGRTGAPAPRSSTPTAATLGAAGRGRARLAADARRRRRLPAARRAALARARGPPGGASRRSRDLDRPPYVPAGLRLELSAADEVRVGVGSFDPRFHVKDTTVLLAEDLERDAGALPGQLDPAQAARGGRATASSSPATPRATACR